MLLQKFEALLSELGQKIKDTYVQKLQNAGRVASGELIGSVKVYYETRDALTYELIFEANNYFVYLEDGRNPTVNDGDGTVRRKIAEWIVQKGILPREGKNGKLPTTEQLSYAIANKIHNEGYKGGGYLKQTVNEILPQYMQRLEEALNDDAFDEYEIMINDTLGKLTI